MPGTGVIRSRRGSMVFSKNCDACGGVGRLAQTNCGSCSGLGVEMRSETITVRIPAGVGGRRADSRAGEGERRTARRARRATSTSRSRWSRTSHSRREGDNLHTVVAIGVHEAALGAKIEVPAPDGPARLRVPPGTQTGQRFRVRGRGAPSPRDGERGDLVVEVKIMLPKVLDERSKELLREFGRINGERP